MNTIKIKFADKTVEIEDFFFNGEAMAEDALNTYGFYPEMLETFCSYDDEAEDVFKALEHRKRSLERIEEFALENDLHPRDALDICFDGFSSDEYQRADTGPEHEMALIEGNIRKWRGENIESGRPTLYGKKMRQTAVFMPEHMIAWLKAQPGTMSEVIRAMIERELAAYQKKAGK